MTANAQPCARGCIRDGRHAPACTCTPTCPSHSGHCFGCQPRPAVTGRLCHPCTQRIRDALTDIPDLCTQLANREDGRIDNHSDTGHIRRPTPGYRTPSPAFDMLDETCRLIWTWVDMTADHTATLGPPRFTITALPAAHVTEGTPGGTIGDLCRWLREHLDWAAREQPLEVHEEIVLTRRALQHALSADEFVERIQEPCPACGQRTLTRDDGTENITCGNVACLRVWRQAEWVARLQAQGAT